MGSPEGMADFLLHESPNSVMTTDFLPPAKHRVVSRTISILQKLGFDLSRDHQILDFGCGSGQHVYEFRNAGYEAYGVDLGAYFHLRTPEDGRWFAISQDPDVYRLPFPDNSFDVITSTVTLEHLRFYDAAFREIRRVLKPSGISLHVFPAKWSLIEPHFKAPFGGAIRWEWYYYLCSAIGFKGADYHAGQSAREQARMNWEYSRTALNYLTKKEIEYVGRQFFGYVRFAEKEFIESTISTSAVSRLSLRIVKIFPSIIPLYRCFHTKVLVLSGHPRESVKAFGSWKLPRPHKDKR